MPKPGTNKERCKRYTASGHREANKQRRQERAKKRAEYFAKRREEGKGYEYTPNPFNPETQRKKYYTEVRSRSDKNADRRDDVSKWRSVMRKVDNEIHRAEEDEKKKFRKLDLKET